MKPPINLYAPPAYIAAAPEVRAAVCNGCGTAGWKGDLVPDDLLGLDITAACNIHDWMYTEGETLADKDTADRTFLNNMLRLIVANDAPAFLSAMRRDEAWMYYQAVAKFGGPAFWAGKNPDTHQIPPHPGVAR